MHAPKSDSKTQKRATVFGVTLALSFVLCLFFATSAFADWQAQTSGTVNALDGVSFANTQVGWSVGLNGTLRATANGGTDWTTQTSVAFTELCGVYALAPDTAVAVGWYGMILKTTDGGATWVQKAVGLALDDNLQAVTFAPGSQTGYAVGTFGTVLKTTDGGDTWSKLATVSTNFQGGWDVSFRDAQHGMFAGTWAGSAAILITADGGATWTHTPVTIGGNGYVESVATLDATHAIAVGDNGTVLKSVNDGVAWTTVQTNVNYDLYDVQFAGLTTGIAVGFSPAEGQPATILRTDDGGASWAAETNPSMGNLFGVSVVNAGIVYASDDLGGILKYTDTIIPTVTDNAPVNTSWHRTDVTVALSPVDTGGSGVQKTQYKLESGGTWTDATDNQFVVSAPLDGSNDGPHVYYYQAFDNAGNVSATGSSVTVNIDSTIPTVTDNAPVNTSWHRTDVTVTLSPADTGGSGVQKTQYKLHDSETWIDASGNQFVVSALAANNGSHDYDYQALDNAGNISLTGHVTVNTDSTIPTVVSSADGVSTWSNQDVIVTLSPADTGGSGVQKTQYKLESGGTWTNATGDQFGVSAPLDGSNDGPHVYYYQAFDNAGNVSDTGSSVTVNIDATNPTVTSNHDSDTSWHNTAVTVTLSPLDTGGSLVAKTQYKLESGGAWTDATDNQFVVSAPLDGSNDGPHLYYYQAFDNAGNVSATGSVTVNIDTTIPGDPLSTVTATYSAVGHKVVAYYEIPETPSDAANAPMVVTLTVTDNRGRTVGSAAVFSGGAPNLFGMHQLSTAGLNRGSYRLSVAAADSAGNHALHAYAVAFTVR
jgi:photosystem II stability/assembly factor-like uncharacterized protein